MIPEPTVRVTRYEVSCLPEGHKMAPHMTVRVEYRGRDRWAVIHDPLCLSACGEWDYEMRTSERAAEWLDAHRFDLVTALKLAKKHAPLLSVAGWTPMEILAREAAEEAGADV